MAKVLNYLHLILLLKKVPSVNENVPNLVAESYPISIGMLLQRNAKKLNNQRDNMEEIFKLFPDSKCGWIDLKVI